MLGDTNYFNQFNNIGYIQKMKMKTFFSSDHPGVPFFF